MRTSQETHRPGALPAARNVPTDASTFRTGELTRRTTPASARQRLHRHDNTPCCALVRPLQAVWRWQSTPHIWQAIGDRPRRIGRAQAPQEGPGFRSTSPPSKSRCRGSYKALDPRQKKEKEKRKGRRKKKGKEATLHPSEKHAKSEAKHRAQHRKKGSRLPLRWVTPPLRPGIELLP